MLKPDEIHTRVKKRGASGEPAKRGCDASTQSKTDSDKLGAMLRGCKNPMAPQSRENAMARWAER